MGKTGNEGLHSLLFVLQDDGGVSVENSKDLANLLVNRHVELLPPGKVRCHGVTDPCPKLREIIDYASKYTARLSCPSHSAAESVMITYQERLHI